jgi:hypothetical protein
MEKEFDNPSSNELRFAGDVNIEKVEMYSLASGASFDIKNQVLAIQIYEDLFSPFITGSLIIKDSLDLVNKLPYGGQEYLSLKVFTPTLDVSAPDTGVIQGNFYVYKITDREYVAEKSVVYQIHFISTEAVVDLNLAPSRQFSGKISDIVGSLLKDDNFIGTEKILTVETTKNETKFISNFWSPLKCINYLLQQATNPNGSTTYVFFENRAGFNFVSLDYLNEKEVHQVFVQGTTTNDVNKKGGSTRVLDRDFSKILEISVPHAFDYIDRVRHGTYASKLTIHDFTTKRYKTVHYDYLKKFLEGKEARLNQFPITTDLVAANINALGIVSETANQLFTGFGIVDTTRAIQDRISRMKQAESFKIRIKVKGRTDYTVGQVVYLDINTASPTQSDDTPEELKDKMFTGNYLVAAINHYIDKENGHECHMEVIKDSLIFDLATGKTS